MNEEIKKIVEQLNDIDKFKKSLSRASMRQKNTISTHWLKKDGYQIPTRFQETALTIALKLKKKEQELTNKINVNL